VDGSAIAALIRLKSGRKRPGFQTANERTLTSGNSFKPFSLKAKIFPLRCLDCFFPDQRTSGLAQIGLAHLFYTIDASMLGPLLFASSYSSPFFALLLGFWEYFVFKEESKADIL